MKLLPESSPLVEIARQGKRLPHIIVTMLMGLIGIQIAPGLVLLASQPLGKWLTQLGDTPVFTGLHQTFYFWFSFIPVALTMFAWVKWWLSLRCSLLLDMWRHCSLPNMTHTPGIAKPFISLQCWWHYCLLAC